MQMSKPWTPDEWLGEYSYASVILGESATAREGVELIGSLIDQQGVCSNDQIVIADSNETWLFAALSGHQWIAMKLADDVASLNPNIGSLNYDVDLDDTENCLHSKAIQSMPGEGLRRVIHRRQVRCCQNLWRDSMRLAGISGLAMSRAETTS